MLRNLKYQILARSTQDGAGVKLRRSIGQTQQHRLDPFLMLDEFSSDNADDYIAGFPNHPHRGFETLTYMLDGKMLHQDHLGHHGELNSGGGQWMCAGRGIIHSEMPQQTSGLLRGFQLWINLPAAKKMQAAAYRDYTKEEFPILNLASGGNVKLLAGQVEFNGQVATGPMNQINQQATIMDVKLISDEEFSYTIPAEQNAFLYVYAGSLQLGEQWVENHSAAVLDNAGDDLLVKAGENGAHFLLLAARPIGEPIVQYGPFVMNTAAEIEQTLQDYRQDKLV